MLANNLKQTGILRLKKQLDEINKIVSNNPSSLSNINNGRHELAQKYYAETARAFNENDGSIRAHTRFYKHLITTQVNLDAIPKPDVDPNSGWVRLNVENYNDQANEIVNLDTQLLTLRIAPSNQGALVGVEYKPRKANLLSPCQTFSSGSFKNYFLESKSVLEITEIKSNDLNASSDITLLAHTQDFMHIRCKTPQFNNVATIYKDYKVKAGTGAHLSNCTTGFALKYWCDDMVAKHLPQYFVFEASILLPSAVENGMTCQVLTSIGGVNPKQLKLTKPQEIEEISGGNYGIRLIDGLNNFVMDLRSAKCLDTTLLLPIFKNDEYRGTKIIFLAKTTDVFSFDKANTVFVSIV
jgi:hypothetical protein